MIALVIGGSGSGKSAFAEALLDSLPPGRRVYLATMEVRDAESAARVERHRALRAGRDFLTVERPRDLDGWVVPPDASVLLEDLGNLLANEMFGGGDWRRVAPGLLRLADRCRDLVVVTNDVFAGGIEYTDPTRAWMRRLAEDNARFAAAADLVVEVVCSIPVSLKGVLPCELCAPPR